MKMCIYQVFNGLVFVFMYCLGLESEGKSSVSIKHKYSLHSISTAFTFNTDD